MAKPDKTAPDKPKKKRSTKAEVKNRREYLEELMIMGHPRAVIMARMAEEFGMKESQVEKDQKAIHDEWAAEKKADIEKKRADQERRLLYYIRTAWRTQDKARCEAVYAKIAGTQAPPPARPPEGPTKITVAIEDYRAPDAPEAKGKKAA